MKSRAGTVIDTQLCPNFRVLSMLCTSGCASLLCTSGCASIICMSRMGKDKAGCELAVAGKSRALMHDSMWGPRARVERAPRPWGLTSRVACTVFAVRGTTLCHHGALGELVRTAVRSSAGAGRVCVTRRSLEEKPASKFQPPFSLPDHTSRMAPEHFAELGLPTRTRIPKSIHFFRGRPRGCPGTYPDANGSRRSDAGPKIQLACRSADLAFHDFETIMVLPP